MTRAFALSTALLLTSCVTTTSTHTGRSESVLQEDALRVRAGFDLDCAPTELDVVALGSVVVAGVRGCGRKAVYAWAGGAIWEPDTPETCRTQPTRQ